MLKCLHAYRCLQPHPPHKTGLIRRMQHTPWMCWTWTRVWRAHGNKVGGHQQSNRNRNGETEQHLCVLFWSFYSGHFNKGPLWNLFLFHKAACHRTGCKRSYCWHKKNYPDPLIQKWPQHQNYHKSNLPSCTKTCKLQKGSCAAPTHGEGGNKVPLFSSVVRKEP